MNNNDNNNTHNFLKEEKKKTYIKLTYIKAENKTENKVR